MQKNQKKSSGNQNALNQTPKVCLTIAGLDPSGGAGIIADIKTFTAFGCFATSAITSLTFQNTTGIFGAIHQTAESIRGQVEPVIEDFSVAALKTGMLPNREVIEEIAAIIKRHKLTNFVVDPVVRSTSGFDLIDDEALQILIAQLFPLSDLVTPNLPEAERITQMKIRSDADIIKAAKIMQSFGAKNVLIKGGHFFDATKQKGRTAPKLASDFLFIGETVELISAEFIETNATHGTGCTLAAAITANLALDKNLLEAVKIAKTFVTRAIQTAAPLGHGHSPINLL